MRGVKKYDKEFKQSAVKKVVDGQSVASVARDPGISEGLLDKWKRTRLESSSDLEKEVIELKKRLREVEMERDILKKAALIFDGCKFLELDEEKQDHWEKDRFLRHVSHRRPIAEYLVKPIGFLLKIKAVLLLQWAERKIYRKSPKFRH